MIGRPLVLRPYYIVQTTQSVKNTGIYQIYFIDNPEKKYVGSTTDKKGFRGRWDAHIRDLIKKKHANSHLQRSFDKRGIDKIRFEIIEECVINVLEKEQQWIDYYRDKKCSFNIAKKAVSVGNYKKSQAACDRQKKVILQYDLDGNFIKEWDSITAVRKHYGIFNPGKKHLSYSRYSFLGYMWRKKDSLDNPLKIDPYIDRIEGLRKRVICYGITGRFYKEFSSMYEAARTLNLSIYNISQVINGKIKQTKGYTFKSWVDNYPLVIPAVIRKFNPPESIIETINIYSGEVLLYSSFKQLKQKTNIAHGTVMKVANKGFPLVRKGFGKEQEVLLINVKKYG